jgi:hypothetical protein
MLRTVAAWAMLTAGPPVARVDSTIRVTPAPAAAAAEAMPVPVSLQLPLILKILTYDRNLASRAQGELRIGIVVAPGETGAARAEIADGFQALADRTVKGLRLRIVTLEYGSESQLEGALRSGQVAVLYVAPGNAGHLDAIVRLARAQRIVTTTGVPGYVPLGIAVGIGVQQDRPQILINLAASRSGGSDFDASLLRIVKIVR